MRCGRIGYRQRRPDYRALRILAIDSEADLISNAARQHKPRRGARTGLPPRPGSERILSRRGPSAVTDGHPPDGCNILTMWLGYRRRRCQFLLLDRLGGG